MPPQTRKGKATDVTGAKSAGVRKTRSTNGAQSGDAKSRREKLQADIAELKDKLEKTTTSDQERVLAQSQLEVREAELDMDVDLEEDSNGHEVEPETTSQNATPQMSIETGERNESQSTSSQGAVDEDEEGLIVLMNPLTISDDEDEQAEAVGWRWTMGQRKQVIMRLGPQKFCTFVLRPKSGSTPTDDIQRISGSTVLDYSDDAGKRCYGVDNIVGFRGVLIHTTDHQQHIYFWVQFRNLNRGLPEGLKMYQNRSWESRSKLRRIYDEHDMDFMAHTLWKKQEERYSRWYNGRHSRDGSLKQSRSETPFPERPVGKGQSNSKGSSQRGKSRTALDSDSESSPIQSSSERSRSTSATSTSESEPVEARKSRSTKQTRRVKLEPSESSLFVSQTEGDQSEPLRFSKAEFMESAIKRAGIAPDDYERLAKLEAAYKVYRHDLLQKGAIETSDTQGHRGTAGADEIL